MSQTRRHRQHCGVALPAEFYRAERCAMTVTQEGPQKNLRPHRMRATFTRAARRPPSVARHHRRQASAQRPSSSAARQWQRAEARRQKYSADRAEEAQAAASRAPAATPHEMAQRSPSTYVVQTMGKKGREQKPACFFQVFYTGETVMLYACHASNVVTTSSFVAIHTRRARYITGVMMRSAPRHGRRARWRAHIPEDGRYAIDIYAI